MYFLVLLLLIPPCVCNHILHGHVVQHGVVHYDDRSTSPYTCVIDVLRPLLCWRDLQASGLEVTECTHTTVRLRGPLDLEDYAIGNVISFFKTDAYTLGCPPAPITDELSRVDQVVFRRMLQVSFGKRDVLLRTEYISGSLVAPELDLKIDSLPPSWHRRGRTVRTSEGNMNATTSRLDLPAVQRASFRSVGQKTIKAQSSTFANGTAIPKPRGVRTEIQVKYDLGLSTGITGIKLKRVSLIVPAIRMEFYFDANAKIEVSAAGAFFAEKTGEIFKRKIPIPGAAFSLSLGPFGTLRAGLFLGMKYIMEVSFGVKAIIKYETGVAARQEVKIGLLGQFDTKRLRSPGKRSSIGYEFGDQTLTASVDGFAGVRPYIAAELQAIIHVSASLGASFGIQLSFGYRNPPYEPVTSGKRNRNCQSCHYLQGTIGLIGKDLSLEVKGPLGLDENINIKKIIFRVRFGTYCVYRTQCPTGAVLLINGNAVDVTNNAQSVGRHAVKIAKGDVIGIRTKEDRTRVGLIAAVKVDGVNFATGLDEWKAVKGDRSGDNNWATKGFNACGWPLPEVLPGLSVGDRGTAAVFPAAETGARYVWAKDTRLSDEVLMRFVVGGEDCS